MNKTTVFSLIVSVVLSFSLGATMQAKAQTKSFSGLIPFTTNGDRLGFLDQSSGRIYMYDTNFTNCMFVGQIQQLGQPIQTIVRSQ